MYSLVLFSFFTGFSFIKADTRFEYWQTFTLKTCLLLKFQDRKPHNRSLPFPTAKLFHLGIVPGQEHFLLIGAKKLHQAKIILWLPVNFDNGEERCPTDILFTGYLNAVFFLIGADWEKARNDWPNSKITF